MKYAQIRTLDISNGDGIGIALFVQGCPHRCENCFNQETWNFEDGEDWNDDLEEKFIELSKRKFIKRVSFLGGEPMAYPVDLSRIVDKIKNVRPDIKIWMWSGYTYDEIQNNQLRSKLLKRADYLIDGRYIDELKDFKLKFRGSSNQRVIDVKKSKDGDIVTYEQ